MKKKNLKAAANSGKTKKSTDQFLYAVLAVLFAATAVIFIRYSGGDGLQPQVEGVSTVNYDTELMLEDLQSTVDDGGAKEFRQLKQEAEQL